MSNYPLRGGKAELWEGGVRGACFLHGGALSRAAAGQRSHTLVSAADWFPTLLALSGTALPEDLAPQLYGVDISAVLAQPSAVARYGLRSTLLHNVDAHSGRAALRVGDLKLLRGVPPSSWGPDPRAIDHSWRRGDGVGAMEAGGPDRSWWRRMLGDGGGDEAAATAAAGGGDGGDEAAATAAACGGASTRHWRLFNISADPEERIDLASDWRYAADLERLQRRLNKLEALAVPLRNLPPDAAARPPPVTGLHVCTPSSRGPILCGMPMGVWQPWRRDGDEGPLLSALPHTVLAAARVRSAAIVGAVALAILAALVAASLMTTRVRRRHSRGRCPVPTWLASLRWRLASAPVATTDEKTLDPPPLASAPCGQLIGALGALVLIAPVTSLATLVALVALVAIALITLSPAAVSSAGVPGASTLSVTTFPPLTTTVQVAYDYTAVLPARGAVSSPARPPNNIIFILTDDQDALLGAGFDPSASADAPTPMPRTRELVGFAGVTARNVFAHSPICCPSRAQMLTGRYLHNLRVDPRAPPTEADEECMHVDGTKVNNRSFAVALQAHGYRTALIGKYLNRWPMRYVPDGFDSFLGNGGGNFVHPKFVARGMQWMGIRDGRWRSPPGSYTTAIVGNATAAFVRQAVAAARTDHRPFFAMMAPKAAHEPFLPAAWYADTWEAGWPDHEPRPPSWNASAAARRTKHGILPSQPPLSSAAAAVVRGIFRNRWRTLMSVDDAVDAVIDACGTALDRTFVIFTSDHGFTLGEFNMLMDKRHVYDFDTRVPFLVRGPGVRGPRAILDEAATLVDVAPTILAMAGIHPPQEGATGEAAAGGPSAPWRAALAPMDGRSLLPLLIGNVDAPGLGEGARRLLQAGDGAPGAAREWRDAVLIEHYYYTPNIKCVSNCSFTPRQETWLGNGTYPSFDLWCADVRTRSTCWATPDAPEEWAIPRCTQDCYATESAANNFVALRHVRRGPLGAGGSLYAEFQDGANGPFDVDRSLAAFREMYDAAADPWQLDNLLGRADAGQQHLAAAEELQRMLRTWSRCRGSECP